MLDTVISSIANGAVWVVGFVVVLTIVVFFHELGHFMAARVSGVRVDVFSIGFGRRILSFTDPWKTEWRLSMWPLGGYVKFFGDANAASVPDHDKLEQAEEVETADSETEEGGRPFTTQFPRPGSEKELEGGLTEEERKVCFHFKPVGIRAFVVAAGPIANFILALAIFTFLFMSFGERIIKAQIADIQAESAAASAGLMPGDVILEINDKPVTRFRDVRNMVVLNADVELDFLIERDGEEINYVVTPRTELIDDGVGGQAKIGRIGVSFAGGPEVVSIVQYGFFDAVGRAAVEVVDTTGAVLKYIKRLVFGQEDASQIGGPLRIVQYSGEALKSGLTSSDDLAEGVRVGLLNLVHLSALLSISIGLFNLFPIPMLDGGHLMYYAYEAATGRPLSARAQGIGFRVGLMLLLVLMAFATWNDLNNLRIFERLGGVFS